MAARVDAVRISVDLIPYVQQLTVLLNAVDCFPNGGLYSGPYAIEAARRYEEIWLPLLAKCTEAELRQMIPPLDVAFAWLVHRLSPAAYAADLQRLIDPAQAAILTMSSVNAFTFTNGDKREQWPQASDVCPPGWSTMVRATLLKWAKSRTSYSVEPFFPPKPLTQLQRNHAPGACTYFTKLSVDLPAAMGRQGAFLHSLLRPCYLERPFLQAAQQRYLRFLQMHKAYPQLTLVPMMDIDLMWHTHMGLSGIYRTDMMAAFGRLFDHDDGIQEHQRMDGFAKTKAAYEAMYPGAGQYNPPPTQLIPMSVRHPLEPLLGHLLELYLPPGQRTAVRTLGSLRTIHSAPVQAAGPALPPYRNALSLPRAALAPGSTVQLPAGGAGHVGGHAVFLAWMMARCAAKTMSSKWNRLFKSEEKRKLNSIRKAVKKGLRFSSFQVLPLRMTHKYWQQFQVRDATAWGISAAEQQAGVAMGTPVPAPAPSKAYAVPTAAPYSAGGCCPGCGARSAACRCAVQGYTPFDLALLPVLLDLALAEQRQSAKAEQAKTRSLDSRSGGYAGTSTPMYSNDGLFLMAMMYSPTWDCDVQTSVCGDSSLAAGWGDPGTCSSWEGVSGNGGWGAAPCGGAACGGGDGGGGGGGCGGGGGGCGGGGGGD